MQRRWPIFWALMWALRFARKHHLIPDMLDCAHPANEASIARAAAALAAGHLVVFPTETVYGLGADAFNAQAVARIYSVKGRPADHPLILHVASIEKAKSLCGHWPDKAQALAQAFWPGPLTLILNRADRVPDWVTGGQSTVGVRIPAHPWTLKMLSQFEASASGVVCAPSANPFGAVSATRASDVLSHLGPRLANQDMVIDAGDCDVGVESTIVDLSGGGLRLLRPGGLSRDRIDAIAGPVMDTTADLTAGATRGMDSERARSAVGLPRVSGSLASHYAPLTPLSVLPREALIDVVSQVLGRSPKARIACMMIKDKAGVSDSVSQTVMSPLADRYAHDLYAVLHDLDARGFDRIYAEEPPQGVSWEAVHDRLRRASHRESQGPLGDAP